MVKNDAFVKLIEPTTAGTTESDTLEQPFLKPSQLNFATNEGLDISIGSDEANDAVETQNLLSIADILRAPGQLT